MRFDQLHELVKENDEAFTKKAAEYPRMHETNTMDNAIRRDFEQWWDNDEVKNYKFPSEAVRDACKNCAMRAWQKSLEEYYINSELEFHR